MPTPTSAATPPIRVLLVDDHKTMLWGLERLLERGQPAMQVVGTAGDGASALAQCAALQPAVVVLDLDLAGVSSTTILPALLASGARVLLFTGSRDQAMLSQAVRLGARGVVSKDVPGEDLLRAIDRVHQGELWLDQAMLGSLLSGVIGPATPVKADPQADKIASLTAKERKVIDLVLHGSGAGNKELAARAFISEQTLRNHLTSIYQKLAVGNRLELYVYASKHLAEPRA